MKLTKRARLQAKGWNLGGVKELLGLTDEETAYIELKLSLSNQLKAKRAQAGTSQAELAGLLGSSQSRVAKMESGDPSVTVDLLVKALIAMGTTRKEIAGAIAKRTTRAA